MRRCAIVLFLLLIPAVATASPGDWRGKVIAVEGLVAIHRPGIDQAIAAAVGFEVFEGDVVTTGNSGRTKLLLSGQLVVYVGPATEIRVDHTIHDLKKRARINFLSLRHGAIRALLKQRERYSHTVRVDLPSVVVSGRNGYFVVSEDEGTGVARAMNLGGEFSVRRQGVASATPVDVPVDMIVNVPPTGPVGDPVAADDAQQRTMLAATEVDNLYIWRNRPGSTDNLVERIWRSGEGGAPSEAGMLEAAEGEGGAEFDAFGLPGWVGRIRQEDLPRLPERFPTPEGIGDGVGRTRVNVLLRFPGQENQAGEGDEDE